MLCSCVSAVEGEEYVKTAVEAAEDIFALSRMPRQDSAPESNKGVEQNADLPRAASEEADFSPRSYGAESLGRRSSLRRSSRSGSESQAPPPPPDRFCIGSFKLLRKASSTEAGGRDEEGEGGMHEALAQQSEGPLHPSGKVFISMAALESQVQTRIGKFFPQVSQRVRSTRVSLEARGARVTVRPTSYSADRELLFATVPRRLTTRGSGLFERVSRACPLFSSMITATSPFASSAEFLLRWLTTPTSSCTFLSRSDEATVLPTRRTPSPGSRYSSYPRYPGVHACEKFYSRDSTRGI